MEVENLFNKYGGFSQELRDKADEVDTCLKKLMEDIETVEEGRVMSAWLHQLVGHTAQRVTVLNLRAQTPEAS